MLVEMFGGPEIISENPEIYATPDDVLNSMEWWGVDSWNKARDDGDDTTFTVLHTISVLITISILLLNAFWQLIV